MARMNREALLERKRELQALGRTVRPGSHQEQQAHADYDQVCDDLRADREQRIVDLEAAGSNPDALEEQASPSLVAPIDRGPVLGSDERVADVDGAVRGFASAAVVPFFHDGSRRLRLTAIAVSASYRGRGFGHSLLSELERWGREQGGASSR